MSVDILSTKDRVHALLIRHEHLRDDDNKLIANIWHTDAKTLDFDPNRITGYKMLQLISEGALTNPEAIRRSRQKWQEKKPELAGKSRPKRLEHEDTVLEDLSLFNSQPC